MNVSACGSLSQYLGKMKETEEFSIKVKEAVWADTEVHRKQQDKQNQEIFQKNNSQETFLHRIGRAGLGEALGDHRAPPSAQPHNSP